MENELPTLALTPDKDRRTKLIKKLAEYHKRNKNNAFRAPETINESTIISTRYRIIILTALLINKTVDICQLTCEINKHEDPLNEELFDDAHKVIADYNEAGGKNLTGGTGL